MHRFSLVITVLIALLLNACRSEERKEPDVTDVRAEVQSEDLDKEFFECRTVKDVQNFLNKHPYLANVYFPDLRMDEGQLVNHLYAIHQNEDFRGFKKQLDSLIGDRQKTIVAPLTEAFRRVKSYYPAFREPAVKFMVSGFSGRDLYVSDTLIIIGLDYFGGPSARFRPDVFEYQLNRYQPDHIVPSVLFFMAARFNHSSAADRTLLNDMVGFGKDYAFTKAMLPNTPERLILGFSDEQLRRMGNSQSDIWAYFIAGKLLYEKADLVKQKYVGDRPFTTEIGDKVPGGIGRWLGWRIIESYQQKHPDVAVPQLMEMENAVNLLQESGYNGQKDDEE